MKILLIISSLGPGGAERILTILANNWVKFGNQVSICTFDSEKTKAFYKVDAQVNLIPLDCAASKSSFLKSLQNFITIPKKLRMLVKQLKPEIIISFMDQTNLLCLYSLRKTDIPLVVSERISPAHSTLSNLLPDFIGRPLNSIARNFLYPYAHSIIVQTNEGKAQLPKKLKAKTLVIPNPVLIETEEATSHLLKKPCILAIGRLSKQKGFDRLIQAFATISSRHPEWNLYIFGEGSDRTKLSELVNELNLEAKIFLPGLTKTPNNIMQQADLFALSSRYEGFPGVLCEALANALPVLSNDCPTGPKDIIAHQENGLLAKREDFQDFVDKLELLINQPELRQRLSSKAPEVLTDFSLDKILALWASVLFSFHSKDPAENNGL
ncbi:MAG: glycosyltransferase family 4 protein [Bdellovibrionota bacterium]